MKKTMKSKIWCFLSILIILSMILSACGIIPEAGVTVALNESSATLEVGGKLTLYATVTGSSEGVQWSFDNTGAVSVKEYGDTAVVTAVAEGVANISASVGDKKAVCAVTVKPETPVPFIKFAASSKTMLAGGKFTIEYTSGNLDEEIMWASDKEDIAVVADAEVEAVGVGKAVITASASGASAFCTVTVEPQSTAGDFLDFTIEVETGREIRILQLSDTQIIDSSQRRTPDRLSSGEITRYAPENMQANLFAYVDQMVARAEPDLIIMTGDNVYGEFDDAGTSLTALIAVMESYEIPWAPVFGNHDNESAKGVDWQCQQFINAENCLFMRGDVTGNGNYNIGIMQGGELVRVVYMLDSNGCGAIPAINTGKVKTAAGFADDQIAWVKSRMNGIELVLEKKIPSIAAFHIPMEQFRDARNTYTASDSFTIGTTFPAKNGDFGAQGESISFFTSAGMYKNFTDYGTDGVFVGHRHLINTSILYNGIRWTFALKTGTYDRYTVGRLGGMLIKVAEGGASFICEHVVYDPSWTGSGDPDGPDPNEPDPNDHVGGFKKNMFTLGNPNSTLVYTAEPLDDGAGKSYYAYKYYNGASQAAAGLDRCLLLKPEVFTNDVLATAGMKLVFDIIYLSDDFNGIWFTGTSTYFQFRVKAANINSGSTLSYTTANFILGEWTHVEILLSGLLNYEQLNAANTEIGFYTAGGSTIYFANMELTV